MRKYNNNNKIKYHTLRKDQRVFSNSFSAALTFSWQKSTKLPALSVVCSCSERFKKAVSVTTWLMCTTCAVGCWGFGFVFSKDTSFPPNYAMKKSQMNGCIFHIKSIKNQCLMSWEAKELDSQQKRLPQVCGSTWAASLALCLLLKGQESGAAAAEAKFVPSQKDPCSQTRY